VSYPKNKLYRIPVGFEDAAGELHMMDRVLVDTGASKCMVPTQINRRLLHLTIEGRDCGVTTGGGAMDYSWVVVPRIVLCRREEVARLGPFVAYVPKPTDLFETDIKTWLGDCFVVGMNFIERFKVLLEKDGHITFER